MRGFREKMFGNQLMSTSCFRAWIVSVVLCLLFCFSANTLNARRNLRIGRVNPSNAIMKSVSKGGTLTSGSVTTDVKAVVDSKYKFFSNCILAEQNCGEFYNKCYDTTSVDMKSLLESSKESCFRNFFSTDGNLDKVKAAVYSRLSSDLIKLCNEENNRQKLPNNGCQEMIINQSPGYMRYKECVRNACAPMDGSSGDFTGCFGRKKVDALNQAISSCSQVLSTYSIIQSNKMKVKLAEEIMDMEKKSCERMSGKYENSDCKLYVGYTRERYMTKNQLGKTEFYAVTETGDLYDKSPKSFKTYPEGVSDTNDKFFGKFEHAILVEVGSNVFCSYTTFNLPKLFQYDSAYDAQYGSGMTGTAPGGGMGGGDMALMVGAIGTIPAITGLLSKKEGTAKLNEQVSGIDAAKDSLKRITPSLVGMATVSSNKGKQMRIGKEIKGMCVLQGGSSYNEGDTITVRWQ